MKNDGIIGRGEVRAMNILAKIFPTSTVVPQMPITQILSADSVRELSTEYTKHKFDIFVIHEDHDLAIEVNYKHGNGAYKKWMNIFEPHLKNVFCKPVVIEESECESLFQLNDDRTHTSVWQDWKDVINALEEAGVEPQ